MHRFALAHVDASRGSSLAGCRRIPVIPGRAPSPDGSGPGVAEPAAQVADQASPAPCILGLVATAANTPEVTNARVNVETPGSRSLAPADRARDAHLSGERSFPDRVRPVAVTLPSFRSASRA